MMPLLQWLAAKSANHRYLHQQQKHHGRDSDHVILMVLKISLQLMLRP